MIVLLFVHSLLHKHMPSQQECWFQRRFSTELDPTRANYCIQKWISNFRSWGEILERWETWHALGLGLGTHISPCLWILWLISTLQINLPVFHINMHGCCRPSRRNYSNYSDSSEEDDLWDQVLSPPTALSNPVSVAHERKGNNENYQDLLTNIKTNINTNIKTYINWYQHQSTNINYYHLPSYWQPSGSWLM